LAAKGQLGTSSSGENFAEPIKRMDGKTEYYWGKKGDKQKGDLRPHGHHVQGEDGKTDYHRGPYKKKPDVNTND
jgi:hypothetical protein